MVPDHLTVTSKYISINIKPEGGVTTSGALEQPSDDLLKHIRESVERLEWKDPVVEIAPHLAFWRSTRRYDQNAWKNLCARLGVAATEEDASAAAEVNWQELACSNIRLTFEQPGCGCRLRRVLDWERGG